MRLTSAKEEVTVVRLSEGESGLQAGNLTAERVQALTEWYALSNREKSDRGLPDAGSVALILGLSPARVRAAQTDKRILAGVKERLNAELTYMIVEWRPQLRTLLLSDKDEVRLKAGRTLEELAGNIGKGSVNVVNQNFNPVTVVEDDDDTFMERVNRTLRRKAEPDGPQSQE